MRFGSLKDEVTDLGDCDFDMIIYEDLGLCIIEKDLDNPDEYTEKFKWSKWKKEDFDNALEILSRLSKNALRVHEKLKRRRDDFLVKEIKKRCEAEGIHIPALGEKMYVPPTDDTCGGVATVEEVYFSQDCTNEYNQVSVSFREIGSWMKFNIRPLLEEQERLKKDYGERKAGCF